MDFNLFTFSLLTFLQCLEAENTNGYISSLHEKLLLGYDKNVRPVEDPNQVTEVKFGISLHHINVNDETQSLYFSSWLIITWKDQFLNWEPLEYGNLTRIHFSPEDIWTPDISLHNSKNTESFMISGGNVPAVATERGRILWFPPNSGEIPCTITLDNWPSDTHSCKFQFSVISLDGQMVDIQTIYENTTETVFLDNYEENTQWKLVGITSKRGVVTCGEDMAIITIELTVQRMASKMTSYMANSAFALILIVIISYGLPLHYHVIRIVFHLFVLFLFSFSSISYFIFLPPSSASVPMIVKYYQAVTIVTILSLILNITFCHYRAIVYLCQAKFTVNVSKKLISWCSSVPLLKRLVNYEVPYNTLEETFSDSAEVQQTERPKSSTELAQKAVVLLRILNFFSGFLFSILLLSTHYIMKSTIL